MGHQSSLLERHLSEVKNLIETVSPTKRQKRRLISVSPEALETWINKKQ